MLFVSNSTAQTEKYGEELAAELSAGTVVALYGDMGMGKTALVRGIARGMRLDAEVSSPTFALVHDYGGQPPLIHFDMYRITGWDDLQSTGYFDYLSVGAVMVIEWAENIEAALPQNAIRLHFTATDEHTRMIEREDTV